MKLKNFFQILGFREKPRHYPYEVIEYPLGEMGVAKYAQWKHPAESTKILTPQIVEGYRQFIHPGDFCIDIGAHSGDTTLPMGIAAGVTGTVLALEPNPYVYHVLQKNARSNRHLANITTLLAAAGPQDGFMEFEYSDSGFCNGGRHENISSFVHGHPFKLTVFAVNLEKELRADFALLLPHLSFIKVDAEGYDLYVLRSIEGIIREFRPAIKAEVFKNTDQKYREELLGFFVQHDYVVNKLAGEPLVAGELLDTTNLNVGQHYDILALPREFKHRHPGG